jgi:hypothetical protein
MPFSSKTAFYNPLILLTFLGPKKLNKIKDLQNRKIADFGILGMWKCKVDMQ